MENEIRTAGGVILLAKVAPKPTLEQHVETIAYKIAEAIGNIGGAWCMNAANRERLRGIGRSGEAVNQ